MQGQQDDSVGSMFAAKPDDPSSILGARMVEGENQLPQSSADFTRAHDDKIRQTCRRKQ